MSLQEWLNNGWLKSHVVTVHEVHELIEKIDRDVSDANQKGISLDWRLAIAYSASLSCATTALLVSGFRISSGTGQHHKTIQSLKFTLTPDVDIIISLDAICKKRATVAYDSAGTVTEAEMDEAISLAIELRELLIVWLKNNHPSLV